MGGVHRARGRGGRATVGGGGGEPSIPHPAGGGVEGGEVHKKRGCGVSGTWGIFDYGA
jgi:hypothetical protein